MKWKWSNWRDVSAPSGRWKPAAYQFRLMTGEKPFAVGRLLSRDDEGRLCIGQTRSMEGRRLQFLRGINDGYGHSEANIFNRLLQFSPLKRIVLEHGIQYRFIPCQSDGMAIKVEAILLKDYLCRFGELPPLNSVIPDRYDNKTWRLIAQE